MTGIPIGKGPRGASDELVDLLLDCHQRIRHFATLALGLAGTVVASDDEIRAAARAVRRYFAEALPLHVADEEESILPRLRGLDSTVNAALDAMQREHGEHAESIAELVSLCSQLEAEPERHPELRARLGTLGKSLERELMGHLEREETIIFPRLAELPEQSRRDITSELRARRSGER